MTIEYEVLEIDYMTIIIGRLIMNHGYWEQKMAIGCNSQNKAYDNLISHAKKELNKSFKERYEFN